MLGKLLKYEIPALGRKLMPLYIGWMVTAVLVGLSIIKTQAEISSGADFFMVISLIMYIAVATAVFVMAFVTIIQRFNNDLLGDGGYFSHSLPVTATQHLASKTIGATLWIIISGIALLLTAFIIGLMAGRGNFIEGLGDIFKALPQIPASDWLVFVELILLTLLSSVKSILAIYTAITLGHQVNDKVILASIGAYIGLLVAETTFTRILSPILPGLNDFFTVNEYSSVTDFHVVLLPGMLVTVVIGAAYFFICKYFMEKKLNLA